MSDPRHARKKDVRERMARTGENYTAANAAIQRQLSRSPRPQVDAAPQPTDDELCLLIDQFLHLQGHLRGHDWTTVDKAAYATSRVLMEGLESLYTGAVLTTVTVRVDLFDTAHPCSSDRSKELPAYAYGPGPFEVEFRIHQHEAGTDRAYGCEFSADLERLMIVLALFGGAMRVHPLHFPDPEVPSKIQEGTWEVKDQEVVAECLRTWRLGEGSVTDEQDTAPQYLNPWEREAGWTIPPGGTWVDAIVPDSDRADG